MMNATSLNDLTDIFNRIVRISCTETECNELETDLKSLHDRIERFETVLKENDVEIDSRDVDETILELTDRMSTEEEMLNRSRDSKFHVEFEKIRNKTVDKCTAEEGRAKGAAANPIYNAIMADAKT